MYIKDKTAIKIIIFICIHTQCDKYVPGHEPHLSNQWRHLCVQTCILKVEHFPIICQSFIHFG